MDRFNHDSYAPRNAFPAGASRRTKQGSKLGLACAVAMAGVVFLAQNAAVAAVAPHGTIHKDHRQTPKLEFPAATVGKAKSARTYLAENAARYQLPADLSNLYVVSTRESLVGVHTRYQQTLNGIPVEGAEIVVSQKKGEDTVYKVYNNTYPVSSPVPQSKMLIGKPAALQSAWNHLRVHGRLRASPEAELAYQPEGTEFRLVYKTILGVDAPYGFWEHQVDATSGEIVSTRRVELDRKHALDDIPDFSAYKGSTTDFETELARFNAAQATYAKTAAQVDKTTVNGTGLVFDPDPRTTLMNDALLDTASASTFNPAYFTRTLQGLTLDGGVYYLDGPYVSITNLVGTEPPNTSVSTTTDGNWTAKRGNNAFNDAMCYFHIDQNQRYIQSLGFTGAAGILDRPIAVDSDGVGGDDNSYYVYGGSYEYIAFGHGGVDDDEDADVILHEYGHALTHDIVPSWDGGDTGAIGEGFGDYWGGSYSWTTINGATHHPEWAFSWDGHGSDTWSGRFMNLTYLTYDHAHSYGAHETIDGVANYSDQLWSAPIYMAFRDLIDLGYPREDMDTIMLEAQFGLGSGVKMRDMANSIISAAEALFPDGPHADVYAARFVDQQIIELPALPAPILIYPLGGETLNGGSTVNVQWDLNGAPSSAKTTIQFSSQLSSGAPAFFDDAEDGMLYCYTSYTGGSDWTITTSDSYSPTHSWFATDDSTVADQYLITFPIMIPDGAELSFWHNYDLEESFDGAVVEISTDGSTWSDIGSAATQNGYSSTISAGYGNPLAGRNAFSGNSGGFIETIIPLSSYAGMDVQIRFREADDSSESATGWWVDDISIAGGNIWTPVATTAANATTYAWTAPPTSGIDKGLRIKLSAPGYSDSPWVTSSAFEIVPYDDDEDGLPNWWEQQYFGTWTGASPATLCANGINTLLEAYVAGIDPTDPNAGFTLSGYGPELMWDSVSGRVYSVYWTSNLLAGFQPMATNINWSAGGFTDTVHNASPAGYYKLKVDLE